ncbi:MAG: carboxypeptidase-like regulatory domain-containing protein [candidate division KSB1 bacterium]|nr:carboxypeptidase-like regulatory domain-containing protein [candidate division KSB1 bacterium]MDZ7302770.1 carboxypeptidase-like regulatory domain-containing protein [candidate division KSB1 bacterium]MDZ7310065.1 carboxypeptidase-like regulatory domain-containing protein [candidate division KSB1 bacterium]
MTRHITMQVFRMVLLAGALLAGLPGCTENPFSKEKVSALGSREVRGRVVLESGVTPKGVYIWLEGFSLGTYTDENGAFKLTLPPPNSQVTPGGVSGTFKLYGYLANYDLATAQLFTQNGEFVYDKGALDKSGELRNPLALIRRLFIDTEVVPAAVPANYGDTVKVHIALRAVDDAKRVTVDFPNTCRDRDCPSPAYRVGAVFLRKIGASEVVVVQMVPDAEAHYIVTVGFSPVTCKMFFRMRDVKLSPGKYEVIPYLLIDDKTIPRALLETLGDSVRDLVPDYLKYPLQRDGGRFEVKSTP